MMQIATLNPPEIKRRRGGARPGAGRPPSELTRQFRAFFEGDLDALMLALRDLALGHAREDSEGRVYVVAPDRAAICYILDRLVPKARDEGETPHDLAALLAALRGERTSASA